ncbi:MAG: tRNA (N6-threonylcarbamoyladenosine(37)-N6)-methyltransferase TrmO [Acidimicrobiales bacterium]
MASDDIAPPPSGLDPLVLHPIGVVRSTRAEAVDDAWDDETSSIELVPPFDERALLGLDAFSHCLVVYAFHLASWDPSRMSRHPRGNPDWPEVGIFAQRAKDRPNRLGVTTCRVLSVDGATLRVAGLDAIDGTPVVDIKPHMVEFGPRGEVAQPAWATELMAGYW